MRVYDAARGLLNLGIHPGPTVINNFLGRTWPTHSRKMNTLNGPETVERRRALEEAGYVYKGSRYRKPVAS